MLSKPLQEITQDDLGQLKQSSVQEGKSIEYKEQLPGNTDADKKEFLADVSSFANTTGGDLIFGVKEEKGVPIEISGVTFTDIDSEKARLENLIQTGIEPRISHSIGVVELRDKKVAIIVRINRSLVAPHRVTFRGHDKFYARNSSGKYPLDTLELKAAFNLSGTLLEKIKDYRLDRVAQIAGDNTPLPMCKGGKVILHFIPLDSFSSDIKNGFERLANNPAILQPMRSAGWSHRFNLEGVISYAGGMQKGYTHSYIQIYRNGIMEVVEGMTLEASDETQKYIPSIALEEMLLNSFSKLLHIVSNELGISPPVYFFMTLIGMRGFKMGVDRSRFSFLDDDDHYSIDREILAMPEFIIEKYDIEPIVVLKPMFDLLWNACGFKKSLNFDDKNNWIGR